jgi:hypothetical protein
LGIGQSPCDHDVVVVNPTTEAAARRAGERAAVRHYPVDHFEIYLGEWFERAVSDQVAFLQEAFARHPVTGGRRIVIWPPARVAEVGVESVKTFLKK